MASTDTIPTRYEKKLNDADWWNVIKRALEGDFLPRNASGIVTDLAGSLGQTAYRWLSMRVSSGHWIAGDVKVIHPFNGTIPAGEGWMLCDGRQVTQVNYDAEHGSGHWATYIASSPLLNKYLPNMTGKYAASKSTTPQDGTSPITSIGNAGNVADLSHNHQVFNTSSATNVNDQAYDTNGTAFDLSASGTKVKWCWSPQHGPTGNSPWTFTPYTANASLSGTNIQPESIQACFYMRII